MAIIKERWLEPRILEKIERWYWCGVLGELYGGAVETRIANDVEELLQWIEENTEQPRTVIEAAFQPDRLDRLTSRLSAAYKGINILMLRGGAEDFFWKANIHDLDAEEVNLDIHHIFPQDWCKAKGIAAKQFNAIVNKTPISYKANRMIGGVAPSLYIKRIQENPQVQINDDRMDSILASHLIAAEYLRSDNFQEFYQCRKRSMLSLIETVMGKKLAPTGYDESLENGIDEEEA